MPFLNSRHDSRTVRHARLRKKISGTPERPRLSVFKSHRHFFVQIIDDLHGKTLGSFSTQEKEMRKPGKNLGNLEAAKQAGSAIAQRAKAQGVEQVVFDRGGHQYHGAIKALAEAAREAGLKF
jgi:large subunit ribosomal protein L18